MGDQDAMSRKSESVRKYSGHALDFNIWSKHMVDHMAKVHPYWRRLLDWVVNFSAESEISMSQLQDLTLGPLSEPAHDLATKFEQVLVDWLPDSMYNNRIQLAGGIGEPNNGFRVWRKIHKDIHGEGEIVEQAGAECLRTYSRCSKLSEVPDHIDGWYTLFDKFGRELQDAHVITRGMFLNILPASLKSKILEEPGLVGKGHRELATWCRRQATIMQQEAIAEITKKVISREMGGKIHALSPKDDAQEENEAPPTPDSSWTRPPKWFEPFANQINALGRNDSSAKPPRGEARGRSPAGGRRSDPRRKATPSPGRGRLLDWGNKCFHCGSEKHTRQDCTAFEKMLSQADCNKGKAKKDWKPPSDYKSAIGKARDAQREKEKRSEPRGSMKAMTERAEDTASEDDDGEFSQVSRKSFLIAAMRPDFQPTHTSNQFSGMDQAPQEFDPELLQAVNSFAHKVHIISKKHKKGPKVQTTSSPAPSMPQIQDAPIPGAGCSISAGHRIPHESFDKSVIHIRNSKDLDKCDIAALPVDRKELAKTAKKITSLNLKCGPGEILALVDTGSFTHAVDADEHLPGYNVTAVPPSETSTAETACGGTLKVLGKVFTHGSVGDARVGINWSHIRVKCPILSVRCLVDDGHEVWIKRGGGVIRHLKTGKELNFVQHAGVYYIKMKIDDPKQNSGQPLFSRRG